MAETTLCAERAIVCKWRAPLTVKTLFLRCLVCGGRNPLQLDKFIESLRDTVADLRRQFACQAFDAMVATVHTLKGAGGTLGFPEVSGVATRMEVALGRADGSDLAYLLDQFAILVERLRREPACAGVPV